VRGLVTGKTVTPPFLTDILYRGTNSVWNSIWPFPVVAILFLTIVGCEPTTSAPGSANRPTVVSDLNDRIAKDGLLTFRSWSGKLLRTDSDTEITFLPEQRVHMTEYGFVVNSYDGSYRIDASGEVTAKFEDFRHEWPVMLLQKDSTSLLLRPKDPKVGFVMGNRGGATVLGDQGSYWPFRPISVQEQADVRQRLKK
jgi:hypothetical protein